MDSFNKFYFNKFEFNESTLKAKFYYSFDNKVFFEEIISFSSENFITRKKIDIEIINNILFHMHIALWISYYKIFPTKELIVETGYLNKFQIEFWKKFYINWLWEFLFTNKISPKWLFNFISKSNKKYIKKEFSVSEKSLVPIWWWKDSIVTLELLKQNLLDFDLFVFWKKDELKQNTADVINKNILLVTRKISPKLIELNNKWFYNWHVPITWIIAFVIKLTSYLYDYKYLILSNEKSANFWNIKWDWIDINHQYSKSLEFEKDFSLYVEKYISSNIKYFSLLRWMYEVKIAELFSKLWKKYFSVFSSCNENFKIINKSKKKLSNNYWCNNCPKCAFVFSILSPYLEEKEILQIFGQNLYEKKELKLLFRELLWISWIKPFECVWEADEVIFSMYKSIIKNKNKKLPFILENVRIEVFEKMNKGKFKKIEKKLVTIWSRDIIPKKLKEIIFKNI